MEQFHTQNPNEVSAGSVDASQICSKNIATLSIDIKKVFSMFCQYSESTDVGFLKDSDYRKLLIETRMFTPSTKDKNNIYLLFLTFAQGKKYLTFELFKSSLLKIAEIKHPELYQEKPKQALLKIMEKLSNYTIQQESKEIVLSEANEPGIEINSNVAVLVSSILPPLRAIYHSYFFIPLKKIKKEQDLCTLLPKLTYTFLRDFSLCPDLISKQKSLSTLEEVRAISDEELMGKAALMFSTQSQKKKIEDYGNYFSFKRFLHYLIYASTIGFSIKKVTPQSYSVAEQFFYILTKMELSNGFQRLQKIGTKFTFNSLIPSQAVLAQIIVNNPMDIQEPKDNVVKKERFIEREMMALDLFSDKLRRIFLWYCSIGTSADSNQLTIVKYIKLLRDAGIVKEIKSEYTLFKNEAEIIYSKVISAKNNKKLEIDDEDIHSALRNPKLGNALINKQCKQAHLEYEDFIYALSLVAQRLYPNINPDKALILISENVIVSAEPT